MASFAHHCAVLGLPAATRRLTADEIQKAYRVRALEAHPDKPSGSAEAFRRITVAKEALMKSASVSRSTGRAQQDPLDGSYGSMSSAASSPASSPLTPGPAAVPPPPFTKQPELRFAATLMDGSLYVFDIGARAFGDSGLRNGDAVKRFGPKDGTDGALGVIIGAASTGTLYWWRKGSAAATPFGHVHGSKATRWLKLSKAPPTVVVNATSRQQSSTTASPSISRPASFRTTPSAPLRTSASFSTYLPTPAEEESPSSSSETEAAAPSVLFAARLRDLQRRELAERSVLCQNVDVWVAQAWWVANLPHYAPLDRQYNAAYL
jgi:hypothetical protein